MPVTIGKAIESDYTNPLGLLSDCHRRIERFLQLLITIVYQSELQAIATEMASRRGIDLQARGGFSTFS